jgi:hypothetical protein
MTASASTAPSGLVWIGVLAPPFAWAGQLITGYLIEEGGCGRPASALWGVDVETISALAIAAAAIVAALGWLASLRAARSESSDARGLTAFLATAGLVGAPIFLLAIILDAVALTRLNGCRPG